MMIMSRAFREDAPYPDQHFADTRRRDFFLGRHEPIQTSEMLEAVGAGLGGSCHVNLLVATLRVLD